MCLGVEHVPVGLLTPRQRELARASAKQSQTDPAKWDGALLGKRGDGTEGESHSARWLVNRPSHSTVKAFSGTGHTLGGSGQTSGVSGSSESLELLSRQHEEAQQVSSGGEVGIG